MSDINWVLDHIGIASRDLNLAQSTYQRLGFRLTARSIHAGAVEPGGPVVPWGSGNHCAMLDDGYIELLGIVDASLPSSAAAMLERYEGAHIVAFGCDDADNAYAALREREPRTRAPAALERDAPFGEHDESTRRAKFRNIYLEPDAFPPAKLIFIEHGTPDVLWQPHLCKHPNTATSLVEVALCTDDVPGTAEHLAKMLNVEADHKSPDVASLDVERGRVYLLSPKMVPSWAKDVQPPAVPSVVGLGVGVRDLDTCKSLLDTAGVEFESHPYPAIWVRPSQTLGPVLSFIQV
ncbi:MAG: VOC family protein [Gammaproteobacteria bacterium]|nr:VOC family protein [Gammaproteobacteria bacterium]